MAVVRPQHPPHRPPLHHPYCPSRVGRKVHDRSRRLLLFGHAGGKLGAAALQALNLIALVS
eukprot:7382373-Prymnesium_polylepis.2